MATKKQSIKNRTSAPTKSEPQPAKKPTRTKSAVTVQQAQKESATLSGDSLPRRTLEDAVEVARKIRAVHAANAISFDEVAKTLGVSRNNPNFKYSLWASVSYGLVNAEGRAQNRRYTLAETGRKIVAENIPGEAAEAKVKATLTPTIFSKFFTEYNGHPIPPTEEHFTNVLEDRFKVPRDRTAEAMNLILANGKFAGILEDRNDGTPLIVKVNNVPKSDDPPLAKPTPHAGAAKSGSTGSSGWEKICFYITPLGEDGSEQRKHADMMLKHVIRPAFEPQGFKVVRADEIAKSGIITKQIFEHLANARICVADLSFHNPNAFYELGVRHAFLLPTIQLIHKDRTIPFDVSQGRTITIETSDSYMVADHLESARKTLAEYVKNMLDGEAGNDDNPIAVYLPSVRMTLR